MCLPASDDLTINSLKMFQFQDGVISTASNFYSAMEKIKILRPTFTHLRIYDDMGTPFALFNVPKIFPNV